MEMSIAAHRSVVFRFDNKLYFGYVCVGFCMFLCYRLHLLSPNVCNKFIYLLSARHNLTLNVLQYIEPVSKAHIEH